MEKEWTWNIFNNHIIKSDVYIKLRYTQISLDKYQHISYHVHNPKKKKKKEENSISTKASFSNQNMQNDIVTARL